MSEETKTEEVVPKTEDTPPPAPDPTPEPKHDDGLNEKVDRLQEEISGLRTLVENVVNQGEPDMDKGPVKGPWTHWKPRSK